VFEAEIRVKSTHLIKSRLKARKKQRKSGNKRHFYIKLHLKDCFGIEFTTCSSELMPEEALTSFTISDAYREFAGQSQFRSESRSHIEYIMPTKIIMLDLYFNLTKKSNLIDRL